MKILDTILKIESDSKAKVTEAQKKAREIKESAEKENAERLNAVRSEAAALLLTSINKTKKEWEEKYQQILSSQEILHADFIKNRDKEIDNTVDKVLSVLIKP